MKGVALRPWQLARLLFDFLVLGFHPALQLFDVFFWWQLLWCNAALAQHGAHALVVLHMLLGDGALAQQIGLLHVVVGHFRGQVLGRNGQRGQKVGQRARLHDAVFVFHHLRGVATKQGRIPPGPNAAKPGIVHTALVDVLRQRLF